MSWFGRVGPGESVSAFFFLNRVSLSSGLVALLLPKPVPWTHPSVAGPHFQAAGRRGEGAGPASVRVCHQSSRPRGVQASRLFGAGSPALYDGNGNHFGPQRAEV